MKEFKTIAEQVSILQSRGMHVGREASAILLRENYYSVINGHKDPFLDKKAMQSSADDVYIAGSKFEWVFSLFQFDRELRRITFSYHLFETTLRTEGDRKTTPHEILRAYDVLTHFRNLCVHDERLYCAKVGNDDYANMLKLMEVALPRDAVRSMKKDIERLLQKYNGELNVITTHDIGNCLGL